MVWPIKHVDAKQTAAIQIIHATVQCKVIAYVAQTANVLLAFVKKLLDKCENSNFQFYFLFFNLILHHQDPMILQAIAEICQPVFPLGQNHNFCV